MNFWLACPAASITSSPESVQSLCPVNQPATATASMQSLTTGVNVIAPVLAGVLYASLAHSTPYWLGLAMMVAAVIVLGRIPFASPSKRTASEPDLAATTAE